MSLRIYPLVLTLLYFFPKGDVSVVGSIFFFVRGKIIKKHQKLPIRHEKRPIRQEIYTNAKTCDKIISKILQILFERGYYGGK